MVGTLGHPGDTISSSSYTIDGGTPTIVSLPVVTAITYAINFYTSNQLSNSDHTLTIKNLGNFFWLDYLEVTVPDPSSPAPQPASSSEPSTAPQAPTPSTPPTPPNPLPSTSPHDATSAPSPTPSVPSTAPLSGIRTGLSSVAPSSPSSQTESSTQIQLAVSSSSDAAALPSSNTSFSPAVTTKLSSGAIAGIAIASVALILFIVLLCLFLRRRKTRETRLEKDFSTPEVTPFRQFFHLLWFMHNITSFFVEDTPRFNAGVGSSAEAHSFLLQQGGHGTPRADGSISQSATPSSAYTVEPFPYNVGVEVPHDMEKRDLYSPRVQSHHSQETAYTGMAGIPNSSYSGVLTPQEVSQGAYRRSIDGGVRLGGGPIHSSDNSMSLVEGFSPVTSTLPPLYSQY